MSNIDGFTPNHLLQQMYGTQVVDEDVEVRFSDEELELIAGSDSKETCNEKSENVGCSRNSDVIVGGRQIISLDDVLRLQNNHQGLIDYINKKFSEANIPISDLAAKRLAENLRDEGPRVVKREHRGFIINLSNANLCFLDTPGCNAHWILQG